MSDKTRLTNNTKNYLTVIYSEIPFSKNLCHVETIWRICFANLLTGFSDWKFYWKVFPNRMYKIIHYFQHFNLLTFYIFFPFDMENTVLWLA